MALGFLKIVAGAARGIGGLVKKIKAKKAAKIQKRIDKAVAQKTSLSAIGGYDLGGGVSAIKAAAANLVAGSGGSAGLARDAVDDGEVKVAGGLPFNWKSPFVLVGLGLVAIFLLPKLLKRVR